MIGPVLAIALCLGAFSLGLAAGGWATLRTLREFRRSWPRRPGGPPQTAASIAPVVQPVRAGSQGTNPEQEAQLRAMERVLERGTDELMDMNPALTRERARREARGLLEQSGAFTPMGGIPGA